MSKINRYHAELFADYLAKLRATPDGDGSLLDHMTILYGVGHLEQQRALGRQPAAPAGRRRRRTPAGRPSPRLHGRHRRWPTCWSRCMDKLDVPVETRRRQHRQAARSTRVSAESDANGHAFAAAARRPACGARRRRRAAAARPRRSVGRGEATATARPCARCCSSAPTSTRRDGDGTTALHWASHRDDVESGRSAAARRRQRERGERPRAPRRCGWPARTAAPPMVGGCCRPGPIPTCALLLGETPLMVASRVGQRRRRRAAARSRRQGQRRGPRAARRR